MALEALDEQTASIAFARLNLRRPAGVAEARERVLARLEERRQQALLTIRPSPLQRRSSLTPAKLPPLPTLESYSRLLLQPFA